MYNIEKALLQDVVSANFMPTTYENQDFTPTPSVPWAEARVIVNESVALTLNDCDEATGILRITLHYPVNSGSAGLRDMQTEICRRYYIGRVLDYEGQRVTVTGHGLGPSLVSGGWYTAYVDVRFISFTRRLST